MHNFKYLRNELYCEDLSIRKIAEDVDTPFYLYSYQTLLRHYQVFDSAFAEIPHITCFAVKSLSNLSVLRMIAREGGGADIVSGGELFRALKAGVDPKKIVFAGVGKKSDEISYALKSGIMMFNVESTQELQLINEIAGTLKKKAKVALRINPDIDPISHPYISTGLKKSKFGISINMAVEEYSAAAGLKNIEIVGIHNHIGSQITDLKPLIEAVEKIVELIGRLKNIGIEIKYIDVGGGLGISYDSEEPPYPSDLAKSIIPLIRGLGCTLILEPGRVIVGNAGILVSKVLYTKKGEEKNFIIVDAGMNDLIRPSLYDAYHEIKPINKKNRGRIMADIVGPICESGDFIAKDREITRLNQGELIAVMSAGAYGFSMSSNYNSRPRVAEIMVNGSEYHIIRERESLKDLIRGEKIPEFLS